MTNRPKSRAVDDTKAINHLPPLRLGAVTAGPTAHEFVGDALAGEGDLYIEFRDPDSAAPHRRRVGKSTPDVSEPGASVWGSSGPLSRVLKRRIDQRTVGD